MALRGPPCELLETVPNRSNHGPDSPTVGPVSTPMVRMKNLESHFALPGLSPPGHRPGTTVQRKMRKVEIRRTSIFIARTENHPAMGRAL